MADRDISGRKHTDGCNHALCPCYLAGLRAGVKPTGVAYLAALVQINEAECAEFGCHDDFIGGAV